MIDVSVVVPVYKNADTLQQLHARVFATLDRDGITSEIVFVDDASPDNSAAVVDKLVAGDKRTFAVHLPTNVGQHRALLAGLALARGTWTVLMDADLQDPPESVAILIAEAEKGHPIVFAGRRGRYQSLDRVITGRIYRAILHTFTGLPRDAGAFVIVRRDARRRVLALDGPAPFIPTMIWCTGLPMHTIPIERATRHSGKSSYSALMRFRAARRAFAWILWSKLRRNNRSDSSASPTQTPTTQATD